MSPVQASDLFLSSSLTWANVAHLSSGSGDRQQVQYKIQSNGQAVSCGHMNTAELYVFIFNM